LHEIEIIINLWLQGFGKWLFIPMQFFSFLGTQNSYLIIMAWIYWCVDNQVGIRLGVFLVVSSGFTTALKWIFHSPRPYWINMDVKALSQESSFGMPSGHALMSSTFFGRVALWVKKKWVTVLLTILIFLIGLSRIYLGVHFLSDVISGWLFGISLLIILSALEKPISQYLKKQGFWFQIGTYFISSILIVLLFLTIRNFFSTWQIPEDWLKNIQSASPGSTINPFRNKDIFSISGLWFGMLSGYSWLKKEGGFQSSGFLLKRLLRFIFGFSGVIVIFFMFEQIQFGKYLEWIKMIIAYIQYFIISIWIAAIAPIIFIKTGLAIKKEVKIHENN
jgi:membrane-associated phospholipid phosphatase